VIRRVYIYRRERERESRVEKMKDRFCYSDMENFNFFTEFLFLFFCFILLLF